MSFSHLSPEERIANARKGGKAAHASGTRHKFTPEMARIAGKKGGEKVSANREHMAAMGRKGAAARAKQIKEEKEKADAATK